MEYKIDCTEWSVERLSEFFSIVGKNAKTKIVLSWEESNTSKDILSEKLVADYLGKLGIPCHLNGYAYLKYSIIRILSYPEELESVTKILYPAIAKRFNTTAGRVEHGIRHAIRKACEMDKTKEWETIFGRNYSIGNSKPTNSQFIATLSDYININRQMEKHETQTQYMV